MREVRSLLKLLVDIKFENFNYFLKKKFIMNEFKLK